MHAINLLLTSIVLTTIMVDHYTLFEFCMHHDYQCIKADLCYVVLASPPRHQHLLLL